MSHDHSQDHEHGDANHDCGCGDACGCSSDPYEEDPGYEEIEEEPDPQLDPTKSPGFGHTLDSLADIEVSRDVTIGEMDPEDLTAADTGPVVDGSARELLDDLTDGQLKDRRRAALALAETDGSPAVVKALSSVALTDEDADVRQFAVESLAKLRADGAGNVALKVSVEDDDPWVRAEALVALDRIDRERYADRLESALSDEHHAARRNALVSLFKLRGEAILDEALELAADPSDRVREWAAHVLGGIDDDRARKTLEGLAMSDDSDIVALTARHARSVDPDRFRRQFAGALEEGDTLLPGEDLLNRQPTL
ncbi:HEAT repeat domain-containing protein [Halosimplex aquaticum]|uniref:HEAT repeat domain-containing protein n=1 Tax=Halosimplex aquaticum TaxID=3026162 RepID=A0ABD5XXQ1_9EURY|nr:HEAT repeat domain-containing protein [Halosimplex aquaticum]